MYLTINTIFCVTAPSRCAICISERLPGIALVLGSLTIDRDMGSLPMHFEKAPRKRGGKRIPVSTPPPPFARSPRRRFAVAKPRNPFSLKLLALSEGWLPVYRPCAPGGPQGVTRVPRLFRPPVPSVPLRTPHPALPPPTPGSSQYPPSYRSPPAPRTSPNRPQTAPRTSYPGGHTGSIGSLKQSPLGHW